MGEQKLYQAQAGWLKSAIEALGAADTKVYAPVETEPGMVSLTPVTSADNITTDYVNTHLSLKEIFFPQSEVLLRYKHDEGQKVEMTPEPLPDEDAVVMGCRPCDAAGLSVFDKVFEWDYDDVRFSARRDHTTVMAWACTKPGKGCFCTAVGGSPQNTQGSDVLAFMNDDMSATLQVLTEKGEALIAKLGNAVSPANDAKLPEPPVVEGDIDTDKIKDWLDNHFEDDFWEQVNLRCLGCGACTYVCPTCHCFDIVDEGCWDCGERRRNWDSCSFRQFTLHASGHNPRDVQTKRCRQRVMHKFKIFPDRFDQISCVGCGRCIRNCGVGQNLVSILAEIQSK